MFQVEGQLSINRIIRLLTLIKRPYAPSPSKNTAAKRGTTHRVSDFWDRFQFKMGLNFDVETTSKPPRIVDHIVPVRQ